MASTVTHLVIGERVFEQLQQRNPADYGAFLLGCILVDVHCCGVINRQTTHFAGRFDEQGIYAYNRSCLNFLNQLDRLLVRRWSELTGAEQVFIAGYLCHLAADEEWKRFDLHVKNKLGIRWWVDLRVPVSVIMTVFDTLSSELYIDPSAVTQVLSDVPVTNVLTNIPYGALQEWWDVIKGRAADGSTTESYFEVLRRLGKTGVEIQAARHENEIYWEDARALVQDVFGGVQPRIQAMVERSLQTVPRLWSIESSGC